MSELLGKVWNSPNTLVGMGVRSLFGRRAFIDRGLGHYEAKPGSAFDRTMQRMGKAAITLGEVVLYTSGSMTRRRVHHELEHVKQGRLWGPAFFPAYLIASLSAAFSGRRIYTDNLFESQARAAEPQVKP